MENLREMYKIVIIGRPNVGKSTLFNRLIRKNRAISHDIPGVTRDRIEGICRNSDGNSFILVDTGGITLDGDSHVIDGPKGSRGFEKEILNQALDAIDDSAGICLVMDAKEGLTPLDVHLANYIRRINKPILLVINKVDGLEKEDILTSEFHSLGFSFLSVSAEHGINLNLLKDMLAEMVSTTTDQKECSVDVSEKREDEADNKIKISILGRPNAGKSSLLNSLIGNNRMIVSETPGTTRDSVDVPFIAEDGTNYVFVDTAGIRRRSKIDDLVEKISTGESIKSATKSDITLYVIDACDGIATQDKRLMELLSKQVRPFIVLINKIDLVPKQDQKKLLNLFREFLDFCPHIPILQISAQKGYGLGKILPLAKEILAECMMRVPTSKLNSAFKEIIERHQPPIVKNARPKFFYLTQAESNPPTFVFFVSDSTRILDSYAKYIEKNLRLLCNLKHTPIRLHFRSSHGKHDLTTYNKKSK